MPSSLSKKIKLILMIVNLVSWGARGWGRDERGGKGGRNEREGGRGEREGKGEREGEG